LVSDIGLPRMSGQDAFMLMKEVNAEVKVILASGYIEPHVKAALVAAGAKSVIHKPYVPDEILSQIRKVLHAA
jgi:CheY-like chemotaxis protein